MNKLLLLLLTSLLLLTGCEDEPFYLASIGKMGVPKEIEGCWAKYKQLKGADPFNCHFLCGSYT
ncbi:hypothetical protein [Marinomonas posidonica]|uniref:Lipoprotein n=1 Tax=Marinomonas posidonica (strain CECT 7376 / NCIMB 14433 / IVIA-Po-181) TaxID=491952 RepID=F6CYI0_MARPP|nr:hypothetical protein [Marinomonas posidonica]AEF54589.1 hypothetical protein Mar181_1548 [Marinomonas posidonica IVIA-Po-181]